MRLIVLGLVLVAACSTGAPGPGIDSAEAVGHAAALVALGPRVHDTAAARAAASYIETALARLDLPVERFAVGAVDLPRVEVLGELYRHAQTLTIGDPDLLVRFGPAAGKALLLMAHYDSVPGSPGAVDNAAAVGVLLALARTLHDRPPPQPVILAFTAGEEVGLAGAEALAQRRGDQIELAIALDLVGGSGPLVLNGAGMLIGRTEMRWLAAAADRAGAIVRAPLPHRIVSRWWPQAERSDHGAFTRRGIRAFHLYNRGQDGEAIDLAYHSPADTIARIDRSRLDELGRVLRALASVPPPPHAGDGFWVPAVVNTVIPRWLVLALEIALALIALLLVAMSDAAVASFARAERRRGAGVLAGIACFALAAAATIVTERVVAGAIAPGHPAPWLHAPRRWVVGETVLLLGVLGLVTRAVARRWAWTGRDGYLVAAIALELVAGLALLAIGAGELAWVFLVPAAGLALAPRIGRAAPIALATALLPALLALAPDQLREAAWNGFLPLGVPLAGWLAVLAAPLAGAIAWELRRRGPTGPLGTLILSMGCGVAACAAVFALCTAPVPCKAVEFQRSGLACR